MAEHMLKIVRRNELPGNNWRAKLERTATSFFPVSRDRTGGCQGCGECCKLPNVCWFLKQSDEGRYYCSVYRFRPLVCRKYPRTAREFLTPQTCGYRFTQRDPAPRFFSLGRLKAFAQGLLK